MLKTGEDETSDMAVKYAVMKKAMELAVDAKDLAAAELAIEKIGASFLIDAGRMQGDAATAISKSLANGAERKKFISQVQAQEPISMIKDEFAFARQLNDLALVAARQVNDQPKVAELVGQGRQIGQVQAESTKVKPAQALLGTRPTDAEANLKVGRYFCFVRGQWERGLVLLSKGNDLKLKNAAEIELKNPTDATVELAIADAWWEIGLNQSGQGGLGDCRNTIANCMHGIGMCARRRS